MKLRVCTCSDCQQQFTHDKIKGFPPKRCPSCQRKFSNERMQRWREANPEKAREAHDRHNVKRLADPEHRRRKREAAVCRTYGITLEEYLALQDQQGNLCAICRKPARGKPNGRARADHVPSLHVDHCHTSGRVRGLLCGNCNTMIGLAGEDSKVLLAAVEYLEKG
jgi:hypothetical protein